MMKILKKNQLVILVIALMLVTAGYLNYSSKETIQTGTNSFENEQYAALGDATLVNSGEFIDEKDKQNILNTIENAQSSEANSNTVENTDTNTVSSQEVKKGDDYFTSSKLERDKMYSQMLETYQKILENTNISQEQKGISEQEISKINQTKNAIMIAENLISTKGFANSVIFVNDRSVNVVIKAEKLEETQIAQVQNIISRELKVEIENIHISNK